VVGGVRGEMKGIKYSRQQEDRTTQKKGMAQAATVQ